MQAGTFRLATSMTELLRWGPLLWTARVLLITLAGAGLYVLLLYLARFLRPKNVRELLGAELPKFRKVGGSAKILGQEISLNGELSDQVAVLEQRVDSVEREIKDAARLIDLTLLSLPTARKKR